MEIDADWSTSARPASAHFQSSLLWQELMEIDEANLTSAFTGLSWGIGNAEVAQLTS